jgi:flagellar hook protein FlgE
MSLTGALFSGVSGLKGEAQALGIISDNIANSNTVGYKGSSEQFSTLVTQTATKTTYTPGGVLPHPFANVEQQGLLQATSSQSDVGIQGNGFFVTTGTLTALNTVLPSAERNLTRAGSFTIDKLGNLVNTAGQYLLGVPTTTSGVPSVATPSLDNLSPVNVGSLTGIASGTTKLSIGANLPAVPTPNTPVSLYGQLGTAIGPKTLTLYSSSGKPYSVTITTVPTGGPPATSATIQATNVVPLGQSPGTTTPAAAAPGPFTLGTITQAGTSGTYQVTGGTAIAFSDGSSLLPTFKVDDFGATGQVGGVAVDAQDITSVVYDSLGVASNLTLEFSRNQTNTGAVGGTIGQQSQWVVTVKSLTVAGTGASAAPTVKFPINLDGTQYTTSAAAAAAGGTITFNTDGTIASGAPSTLPSIALSDGAANFGGTGFTLNLGTANTVGGLTNFSNQFAVSFLNQDGIRFGFRTGVEIDKSGFVKAVFDNGQTVPLYQLPLVTVADANSLSAITGNLYQLSDRSGDAVLNYPGVGGTGTLSPATLESSTVDLSTEFTNMIVTQRSYSANARTITTSDEMLQELLNIKR